MERLSPKPGARSTPCDEIERLPALSNDHELENAIREHRANPGLPARARRTEVPRGYSPGQQKLGSAPGILCDNRREVLCAGAAGVRDRRAIRIYRFRVPASETRRKQGYGGFVEFGDVGMRVGRLDGVWHPGGLWNPSPGVCADASAGAACGSEGAGGSSAGVVRAWRSDRVLADLAGRQKLS